MQGFILDKKIGVGQKKRMEDAKVLTFTLYSITGAMLCFCVGTFAPT